MPADLVTTKTVVRQPLTELPALVPKPTISQLKFDAPIVIGGKYAFPAGYIRHFKVFDDALHRRFEVPPPSGKAVNFDAGEADIGLEPGSYRIQVGSKGISVIGKDEDGLLRGLRRLARLAFVRNGQIVLPSGLLLDAPSNKWRAVEMEASLGFVDRAKALWDNLLLPMGYNKIVLRADAVNWKARPGTVPISMLTYFRDWLKESDVETIPMLSADASVWKEAQGVLSPETVAFAPGSEATPVPNARPIVWLNAKDLPDRAMVAVTNDRPSADPATFYPAFQALKKQDFFPIGVTTQNFQNVYGTVQAGNIEHSGILVPVVDQEECLAAAVLAGDYLWSDRAELPDKLPYDPFAIVREWTVDAPLAVLPQSGIAITDGPGTEQVVGAHRFLVGKPLEPGSHPLNVTGTYAAILLNCTRQVPDGTLLGTMTFDTAGGPKSLPIIYGRHVRSSEDRAPAFAATQSPAGCAVDIKLAPKAVKVSRMTLKLEPDAGLTVTGVTLW